MTNWITSPAKQLIEVVRAVPPGEWVKLAIAIFVAIDRYLKWREDNENRRQQQESIAESTDEQSTQPGQDESIKEINNGQDQEEALFVMGSGRFIEVPANGRAEEMPD